MVEKNTSVCTEVNNQILETPLPKKVVLALQHLIAMFGATVLVPILTGLDPSVALISAGVGTLIFHLVTKGQVPVFLGSSFAFISGILTVKTIHNGDLSYAQGGILVAGLLYVIIAPIVKKVGQERMKKLLPSHVVGPMIIVIGLTLLPVAIDMALNNILIAFITLATTLLITFVGKGFLKQLSILIGVITGYTVCLMFNLVDTTVLQSMKFISMPNFNLPKFSLDSVLIIAPIVIAVFMEHVGDITTNGQVVGKNFVETPGLHRTLLGDGLATMFAALIGGPANTTYGENTGVLAITKNYDPKILRLTAVFAVILGLVSKVGGFLRTIPTPVMGGISIMLFSMIALIGVKTIKNNDVKFSIKNVTIMSTILIIGLGTAYIEKYTGISLGIAITDSVKLSGLSLASIVGVLMNSVWRS